VPQTDGRRLFLGWMSNWQYGQVVPTETWRSAMTVPREVKLSNKGNHYELKFEPVKELNSIFSENQSVNGKASLSTMSAVVDFEVTNHEAFQFILSNDSSEQSILSWDGQQLTFDRRSSGRIDFNEFFPAVHEVEMSGVDIQQVKIFIDQSSVEIFINNGERVMTEIIFPSTPYTQMSLVKKNPVFRYSLISDLFTKNN